jgi:hypothetical protein
MLSRRDIIARALAVAPAALLAPAAVSSAAPLPSIPTPDQSNAQVVADLVAQLGDGDDTIMGLVALVRARLEADDSIDHKQFDRLAGQLDRLERSASRRRRTA